MKTTIASVALSLALMSSAVAEERATDAASAVVRRPIGAVAGAVNRIYGRAVHFAHSWRLNQSAPRQPRSVARREQRVPTGESQPGSASPAPQDQAAPQAAAPARPTTAVSTAPPVQPLE
jgi:hypothetical protein